MRGPSDWKKPGDRGGTRGDTNQEIQRVGPQIRTPGQCVLPRPILQSCLLGALFVVGFSLVCFTVEQENPQQNFFIYPAMAASRLSPAPAPATAAFLVAFLLAVASCGFLGRAALQDDPRSPSQWHFAVNGTSLAARLTWSAMLLLQSTSGTGPLVEDSASETGPSAHIRHAHHAKWSPPCICGLPARVRRGEK